MQVHRSRAVLQASSAAPRAHEPRVASAAPYPILWMFYLFIVSIPFGGFSLFNIGGRGLARLDWLAAGAMVGLFIWGSATRRLRLCHSPADQFVLLFLYTALLSIVNLFDASNAQFADFGSKAAQLLPVAGLFFVVSSLQVGENELRTCLRIWIFTALLTSVYAVYQLFARLYGWPFAYMELTNPSVAFGGMEARVSHSYAQVSSFLREPSYLGAYLIGPILFSGVYLLEGKDRLLLTKSSIVNWTLLAMLSLALLLTDSQGAYLSLLVTIGVAYLARQVERTKILRLVAILLIIFFLGGAALAMLHIDFLGAFFLRLRYLVLNIADPSGTAEVTSFRVRSECTKAALEVWLSRPILGVGLNNMSYYTAVCDFTLGWGQLLADQGLLGCIALFLVFGTLLRGLNALSREARLSSFWSLASTGLFCVLVSDMVNGIVCYNWVDPQRWFTLGMANLVYIRASSTLSQCSPRQPESRQVHHDHDQQKVSRRCAS